MIILLIGGILIGVGITLLAGVIAAVFLFG